MPRQFEPYPGELSAVYEPEADPPEINVEEWVPGTHRLPPNLTASEHVDWRDVNYLGQRIIDLETELEQNGDPGERFRWKVGDDKPTWDMAERINVRDLGAVGDGITDDAAEIQAAIDQAGVAGGTVVFPPGVYKINSTINLKPSVWLVGAGCNLGGANATEILGAAGIDLMSFPVDQTTYGYGFEQIYFHGGRHGLSLAPGTGLGQVISVRIRNCHFVPGTGDAIHVEPRLIERWYLDQVTLFGGLNGFVVIGGRMDKMLFNMVETNGQSKSGWNIDCSVDKGYGALSNECQWISPIMHLAGEHSFVAKGTIRGWTFVNTYTEGGGQSGKNTRTTGSITTGTNALTVASATGLSNGDSVTVAGAGASGLDLFTTISSGGGTTSLVLAANAATTVTNANVTNAIYDDFSFPTGGGNPADIQFLGGSLGGEGTGGHLRYTIDARSVSTSLVLLDVGASSNLPVYDPNRVTQVFGSASVRQPNNFLNFNLQQATIAGPRQATEMVRTLIPSPPGRDLVLALRDSTDNTSGTYGNLEVRKNDANKTAFFQVLPTNFEVRSRGRIVEQGMVGQQTMAVGATTIDVTTYSRWRTANTGATTISSLTGGLQPQTIKILAADSFTTIANNATIKTNTGASKLLENNRVYTFTLFGTVWYEDGRPDPLYFNVRDYGAKGDATTDDKASIQAAIDACGAAGGGQVFFPPGTYRIISTSTSVGVLYALLVSYDNVQLIGCGASSKVFLDVATNAALFAIGGAPKAARLAGDLTNWMNYGLFTGTTPAPGWNLTGTIAEGATSVTLATAGDAANFAVGDLVAIRTGQLTGLTATGQPDAEINVVKSIAGATIGLDVPTVKAYQAENYVSGSTGVSAVGGAGTAVPFQLVQAKNYLARGIRVANLSLETRATRHLLIGGSVDGFVAEDLEVLCRGGASFMSFGATRNQRVRNCRITNRGLTTWTYVLTADAGTSDCLWSNLLITADAQVPYLHIQEGSAFVTARDITIRGPEVAGDFNSVSIRARHYHITLDSLKIAGGGNTATVYTDASAPSTGGTMRAIQTRNSAVTAVAINGPGWIVTDLDSPKSLGVNPSLDNAGVYKQEFLACWLADNRQVATLGTIPQTAMVTDIWMDVTEAFNSDGTDFIRVGFPAGGENWLGLDTDVSTTGTKAAGAGVSYRRALTTDKVIVANYLNGGSEPTTGKALVVVGYVRTPYQIP